MECQKRERSRFWHYFLTRDRRHNIASDAVMDGTSVPLVSRFLGHYSAKMTLRYVHLCDRDIRTAAERVGDAMAKLMAGV